MRVNQLEMTSLHCRPLTLQWVFHECKIQRMGPVLAFILRFLVSLQIPPLGANETAELPEGEVGVPSLDDGPHLAAEQDVSTHVDLPL